MFQRVIGNLLKGVRGVSVYLDDILVTCRSHTEHLQNLQVLKRLKRLKRQGEIPVSTPLGRIFGIEGYKGRNTAYQ